MGYETLVAQHPDHQPSSQTQRARLLDAMLVVTATKGYRAATVADVVRQAGVSRSAFYEHFSGGKEQCFLDAYRAALEVVEARVGDAVQAARGQGWRAELRAGIRAYLATLSAAPTFTLVAFQEVHAAGPAALEAHAETLRAFAGRYRRTYSRARREDPKLPAPPPQDALIVLCAGTEALVAERVRTNPERPRLADLEDVFCACAEALLLGPHRDHDGG